MSPRECAVPENLHTPPKRAFNSFTPLLPLGNSSLALYFASKILTFKTLQSPWEFPMTFHGAGMVFFFSGTAQ